MTRFVLALTLGILVLFAAPARSQLPATIAQDLFPFPGAHVSPGSAASAGRALADRWLGEEPFDNPAAARPYTLALTPLLLHTSRQDLRADHRGYEETSGFFDVGGGYFSMEAGALGVALYGYQPAVRLEDNSFLTGSLLGPAGSVQSNSDSREVRGGLALSLGRGHARVGVAGEWTHRADHYERTEDVGLAIPNTYVADFSGDAAGGLVGARWVLSEGPGGITLGAGLRYMAELDLTGDETLGSVSGTTHNSLTAKREAGWEGGVSGRYEFTDAFHAIAGAGGRTAQKYVGWGVTSGDAFEWKLAGEYHDARDPWTVRFGAGQEQQSDVPEPRSFVFGLGIGFVFDSTMLDLGLLHRSFDHGDHPPSSEDRIALSLVQRF
jgi:hypothetical protein